MTETARGRSCLVGAIRAPKGIKGSLSTLDFDQLSSINHQSNKMHSSAILLGLIGIASAQTLNIPSRVGDIVSLPSPSEISGDVDLGNGEYDRGRACDSDEDTGMPISKTRTRQQS